MKLRIKDTFNKKLPADPNRNNTTREVFESCFSYVSPQKPLNPTLIHVSLEMAELLGLNEDDIISEAFLEFVSGSNILKDTNPYAMCYGGHQFGNWAGQLGDGRAINLTEVEHNKKRWALQLKGAGKTPYSRSADGLAVLRSSIREHLCSEAMHYLGVPTTRSLSLSLSGDKVLRDIMYDGHVAYEKGAIVCRVAPCFIRFGNFEIFASRGDIETLQTLTNYTIKEFYPEIESGSKEGYIAFFSEVVNNTMEMIVHWQRVGFVHGVMNTDNMSIHGLTIDYGPYGWLEDYDPEWTPNTTDKQIKRYRFGNQPQIALWNLYQLANALFPLVKETEPFLEILENFDVEYKQKYSSMMRDKLGLKEQFESDKKLISDLHKTLKLTETDMTIFFRNLANVKKSMEITEDLTFLEPVMEAFYKPEELADTFYKPEEIENVVDVNWRIWFKAYFDRLKLEELSDLERKAEMNKVNPKYVLRNYMAQLVIDEADKGDYSLLDEVHRMLKQPYNEQPGFQKWFSKRPEWARDKVGSSMLSCSS